MAVQTLLRSSTGQGFAAKRAPSKLNTTGRSSILHVCHAGLGAPQGSPQPPQAGAKVSASSSVREREAATSTASTEPSPTSSQDLTCVANGLDGVSCFLAEEEGEQQQSNQRLTTTQPTQRTQEGTDNQGLTAWIVSTATLVSPFFFWGTSMVAMKGLLAGTPPLMMGGLRLVPAGLLLVAWAQAQGRPHPQGKVAWAWVLLFALVDGAMFQGFLAEGLQRTSAGLGSVIIDSQPLTVALLASWLFGERLGIRGAAALLVGVAGLLLLEVPEQGTLMAALAEDADATAAGGLGAGASLAVPSSGGLAPQALTAASATLLHALSHPAGWLEAGEFWMLLAAQAMACGTIMIRYVTKHCDPVMATGWHMLIGGLALSAMAALDDPVQAQQALGQLAHSPSALFGAAYVSLLGGAASYSIFYLVASSSSNLTRLSSLTFLTPVFAAVAGYWFLEETLTPMQLCGAAVTLVSVLVINSRRRGPSTQQQKQQS